MPRTIKNFRQSSSFFMAMLCSILLLAVAGFVIYFTHVVNSDSFLAESRAAIDAKIEKLILLEQIDKNALSMMLSMQQDNPQDDFIYGLFSEDKDLITGDTAFWTPLLSQLDKTQVSLTQYQIARENAADSSSQFQRLESLALERNYLSKVVQLDSQDYLVVARNIDEFRTARWVAMTFGWVVLAITLILIACFFVIGQFVVNKVNAISKIANEIVTTGNISKRIVRDSHWDDLSKLEIVLNKLLDEIESLMLGMKKVTDDIAHDLRTPLTRLRNLLETVEPNELRDDVLKEADLLLGMFNGLLRIAEIESGRKRSAFEILALDEIVSDAEAFYSPLADEKNISINCMIKEIQFFGDRNLLFQMCINLIDNALKFTPQGGSIDITLFKRDEEIVLKIQDTGCGINESDLSHIFKRLYRVESSRHSQGNGLGLSIVEAIVHLHNGTIEAQNVQLGPLGHESIVKDNSSQGSVFTVTFPVGH